MSTRFLTRKSAVFSNDDLGSFTTSKKNMVFFFEKNSVVVVGVGFGKMNFFANLSWRLQVFFCETFYMKQLIGRAPFVGPPLPSPQEVSPKG